jgi:hypothetical protein
LGYSLGYRLVHFQFVDVLLLALPKRLPPLFDKSRLLTQAGHLGFSSERFGLGRQRLLVEFLLLLLQPAVFGPGAGQVALAPRSVALLAALVPGRNNAQHASRRAGRIRPHGKETFGQKKVGKLITTEDAGG